MGVDLLEIPFGGASNNISSALFNAQASILFTNQLRNFFDGAYATVAPKQMVKQDATSSQAVFVKNLLHDGSNWFTPDYTKAFFIDIEATDLTTENDFKINDCDIFRMTNNSWRLICEFDANREVNRAKVFKTLFDDGQSGGARVTTTYINTISAIRSSDAIDIDKRVYFFDITGGTPGVNQSYDGIPVNTTDNNDIQSWSFLQASNVASCAIVQNGVIHDVNNVRVNKACTTSGSTVTSDETESDTSADRINNPSVYKVRIIQVNGTRIGRAYFTVKGAVNFSIALGTPTVSDIDYLTTHNVPVFTATVENELDVLLESVKLADISTSFDTAVCDADVRSAGVVPIPTMKFSIDGRVSFSDDAHEQIKKNPQTSNGELHTKIEFTRVSNTSDDEIHDFGIVFG